jgi:hypothetical protein
MVLYDTTWQTSCPISCPHKIQSIPDYSFYTFSMHPCLIVSSVQQNHTFTYADMSELGFHPFLIQQEDSEIWEENK